MLTAVIAVRFGIRTPWWGRSWGCWGWKWVGGLNEWLIKPAKYSGAHAFLPKKQDLKFQQMDQLIVRSLPGSFIARWLNYYDNKRLLAVFPTINYYYTLFPTITQHTQSHPPGLPEVFNSFSNLNHFPLRTPVSV
jgi:hypothetical protein